MVEQFPSDFCKYKILPEVIKGLEFGGVNPKALETVLEIGSNLQKEDYTTIIIPVIIRLFGSNDRAIRASLCQLMSKYIEYLSESDIDKIFNSIVRLF
jgi:SCY1-like protein 1